MRAFQFIRVVENALITITALFRLPSVAQKRLCLSSLIEGQDSILDGSYKSRGDAIEKCYRAAKKQGFHLFAVQDGGWCETSASAAKTFNKYGNSSACKSDGKGGPWANQVYYIKGYNTVGCYKDTSSNHAIQPLEGKDSILDGSYSSRTNPIGKCAVAATRAGYSMFAVQNGGWCAASATAAQTFDKYGKSTACKADGEGGGGANQVYVIKAIPRHCAELFKSGNTFSGVYKIDPDGSGAFTVFCDQTTAVGGWTVFQKRINGDVDFYRGWADYKEGFGNLNGQFWLGLDKIHRLTKSAPYKIRVDLEEWYGNPVCAKHDYFAVSDEATKYKLSLGTFSGTAGPFLSFQAGESFSTKDQDNDSCYLNCAVESKGGWWYSCCLYSNLNGVYYQGDRLHSDSIIWGNFRYPAKRAEMKIRPMTF